MKAETKYNVGDIVYYPYVYNVGELEIKEVRITKTKDRYTITYDAWDRINQKYILGKEEEFFSSKEEAIKKIMPNIMKLIGIDKDLIKAIQKEVNNNLK